VRINDFIEVLETVYQQEKSVSPDLSRYGFIWEYFADDAPWEDGVVLAAWIRRYEWRTA
jgi:hypothetical protein